MSKRILAFLLLSLTLPLTFAALRAGDDEKKFLSGPQPGKTLPGPFDSRMINGDFKSKQHCLVCEYRLFPVVMVFVKEPLGAKDIPDDSPILYLLEKLEESMVRYEMFYLKGCGIFLSPYAHGSATREGDKKAEELVEEAKNRQTLLRKLDKRAEKFKSVVLATLPAEGPKDYKINPDAEVTIILFNSLKVIANEAFPEGKMTREDADRFIESLDKLVRGTKTPESKKPAGA